MNVTGEDLNGIVGEAATTVDFAVVPTIESISKTKAYVGESLTIRGSQFATLGNGDTDTTDNITVEDYLTIAGTSYDLINDCDISSDSISIPKLKSPNSYGVSDIRIERIIKKNGTIINEIVSVYNDSITVVNEMKGLEIERIDPNAGPKTKKTIISIYAKQPSTFVFSDDMRLFVRTTGGSEAVNKGVIRNAEKATIGIMFELPTSATTGSVDLILCTRNLSSELVIPSAFVYLDIGNTLSIDTDGITPNFKKETEEKIIQIKGRNIGYFNGTGYDKLGGISAGYEILGYSVYGTGGLFNNTSDFKVKYTGLYNGAAVTIIRTFRVIIDSDAETVKGTSSGTDYTPIFTISKDTIYVKPPNVNLDPNEAKSVDVSVQTVTTIFYEQDGTIDEGDVVYNRTEEYTVTKGFTFLPDEITPVITSVTPVYGPSNKEIYMTVKGSNIQVLTDGSLPKVLIGGRQCEVSGVYDDDNNIVDGKKITLGTKIKLKLPAGDTLAGAADVVVVNPSNGQDTLENGFEFRNPDDGANMPYIDSVVEAYCDLRGGKVSGESVVITGGNIFTSSGTNHRVVITIDGEKAEIFGKVSSDGKTVTIVPPAGTIPGKTQLQLINEDGSMVSADFEYKLVTSAPKITSIVPIKGGAGTKLIIKGEDFVLPDDTVAADDTRRKGSVVLLNGYELNAYKYTGDGTITSHDYVNNIPTSDIYYHGEYDPDGEGGEDPYTLEGNMTKVQDITTIYVDIPDSFYYYDKTETEAPYLGSKKIPIGSLPVVVLNPDGAKTQEKVYFNYMNPSTNPMIVSVKPTNGSVNGGTVVTITGSGFKQDDLEVYFGSEKSHKVEFVNSTILKAVVPKYPYSLPKNQDYLDVPVMVMNYDGGVAVMEDGFQYRIPKSNPVIESITPNTGSTAGNDRLIIRGKDFRRTSDKSQEGLPKVFFNGEEAKVEWPSGNETLITETLTVTTPASVTSGTGEVVLVNFDAGTCSYNGFTYIMSKPSIKSVTPKDVSKLGNVNVQINGSNFREGNLSELFSASDEKVKRDSSEGIAAKDAIETLVFFGDEDTGDKATVDTVLGPMYAEINDLRFNCKMVPGEIEQVQVWISQAGAANTDPLKRYHMKDGSKVEDSDAIATITVGDSHLFIINHKMDLGSDNLYDEGILIETTPSSVTITRRIAPIAEVKYEGTQVTAVAPPTDRVGTRTLYLRNDDGGTAKASITITSPDSTPFITSMDPKNRARDAVSKQIVEYVKENEEDYTEVFTFIPMSGGAFLTIKGSDFRRNVAVYLDDVKLEIVSKSSGDDQMVVKIPAGSEADLDKDKKIIVINEDGGTYDSSMLKLPHYIRYQTEESSPVIEKIVPNKSSSRGSNYIAIYGNNFRSGVVVLIDGIECTTTRDATKPAELLSVLVPTGMEPGDKTVQVQNPDFGFDELANGLTIISTPGIIGIYDKDGDLIDPLVLSVEGGEKLTIKGVQFYDGIKVIFGGTLKAKSELASGESGIEGLNINNAEMVIIGGTVAEDAKLQDDGSIVCTSPKLDMGSTSIILINDDGGLSEPVSGNYQKPVPDTPDGIKVEAVDGDTLRLEWDYIPDINYYELYAAISETGKSSSGTYQYVGSIIPSVIEDGERLRYYLDGLQSSTWYNIRIRSVNLFGASQYSTSSGYTKTLDKKVVTYYSDEDSKVSGLDQNDSVVMKGTELTYILGEKSIAASAGAVIELGQPDYATANPKIVKVSFGLMKKYPSGKIKINDADMELALKTASLAVSEVFKVEESKKSDTAMQVSVNRSVGAAGDEIRIKMPRGYKLMMNPFSINLDMQVQNTITRMDAFNGDISLLLKYAESKRSLYPGGVYIAYYDKTTGRIQITNTSDLKGKAQSQISKTGEYVLIGKLIK
ncbi:MAG TPA: IPT/TIG domain-containing protein [Negativicutes bacterium]|nr:IPT/TIG domain-containing protein [Negativicutes bacterium]